ncbi:MAG: hypothetical protein C4519_07345 [Desulfobacteraceae bacterium]|nr:MAG: hypothetical protein C4519_07345 [Desulfobacteraceae bacterium]
MSAVNHAVSINDPFYFPDPVEEALEDYEYFGCSMQQNRYALPAISILLECSRPARMIELGTRHGGLTIFLGIYSKNTQVPLHTFDIEDRIKYKDYFEFLGIQYHICDIFSPDHNKFITQLIQSPQRTILFCDALKIKDFNTYADTLKPGDIILVHDYARDQKDYQRMRKQRIWWTCEIEYQNIADACRRNNLEPLFADMFRTGAWGCFLKMPQQS